MLFSVQPGTKYISAGYSWHHNALLPYSERLLMKPATIIGILLIVLGVIGFALGGVSFTHQKKDVDLGPIQVSHEQKQTIPISPILSTVALIAGIGLVVVGSKGR